MSIKNNLEKFKMLMADTAESFGRNRESVELLAVTKTKPVEYVIEAYESGQRLFGENRVQEAEIKVPQLPSDAKFHLIGHLQSNKVRKACQFFSCIQSVDSLKIGKKIDNSCRELNKIMDIYLDVNISEEDSKSGFKNDKELLEIVDELVLLDNIRIVGLMGIGSHVNDSSKIKNSFSELITLKDILENRFPILKDLKLSMGMSGDFKEAIEMGSTMVRIGSAIFGSRI